MLKVFCAVLKTAPYRLNYSKLKINISLTKFFLDWINTSNLDLSFYWSSYPLIGHHVIYYRYACSITLDDHVVITGGYDTMTRVSRYEESGFVRNMPSLNNGRDNHGCTSFLSGGQQVRLTTWCHTWILMTPSSGVDGDRWTGWWLQQSGFYWAPQTWLWLAGDHLQAAQANGWCQGDDGGQQSPPVWWVIVINC